MSDTTEITAPEVSESRKREWKMTPARQAAFEKCRQAREAKLQEKRTREVSELKVEAAEAKEQVKKLKEVVKRTKSKVEQKSQETEAECGSQPTKEEEKIDVVVKRVSKRKQSSTTPKAKRVRKQKEIPMISEELMKSPVIIEREPEETEDCIPDETKMCCEPDENIFTDEKVEDVEMPVLTRRKRKARIQEDRDFSESPLPDSVRPATVVYRDDCSADPYIWM